MAPSSADRWSGVSEPYVLRMATRLEPLTSANKSGSDVEFESSDIRKLSILKNVFVENLKMKMAV
jgi:hypothetical protein